MTNQGRSCFISNGTLLRETCLLFVKLWLIAHSKLRARVQNENEKKINASQLNIY